MSGLDDLKAALRECREDRVTLANQRDAALKDRNRLRIAAEKVCEALYLPGVPGDTTEWVRVHTADIFALEAALEDRDD